MAEMLPEFDGPKELVAGAREHIDRLEEHIRAFFDREPYARVIDFDRETGQQVFKLRITAKLPSSVRLAFKDATSNLRDALDHSVYASAIALGVNTPEKTGFPFGTDANQLQGELGTWKFSDVPQVIHPILMSFSPYPGGNDLLIGLNRMRNPNTHRVIVPIAFAAMGNAITASSATIVGGGQIGYSRWDAANNEVEYMRLGVGSTFKGNVEFSFDVTFGDVEIVAGKSVVGMLREIVAEVERVVFGLEAETARLIALNS